MAIINGFFRNYPPLFCFTYGIN